MDKCRYSALGLAALPGKASFPGIRGDKGLTRITNVLLRAISIHNSHEHDSGWYQRLFILWCYHQPNIGTA